MFSAPIRILAVAALCVLALIGVVARESYERSRPPSATSRDIDIEMQAIDPRALLAGHYVIVNLQTIAPAGAPDPCAAFLSDHDDPWVAFVYRGPEYPMPPPPGTPFPYAPVGVTGSRASALDLARESDNARYIAVRGSVICSAAMPDDAGQVTSVTVQIQLPGVERFYANQAEAERIDALLRVPAGQTRVYAIVNVGRDGRARLKGLNVNGEVILLSWL